MVTPKGDEIFWIVPLVGHVGPPQDVSYCRQYARRDRCC